MILRHHQIETYQIEIDQSKSLLPKTKTIEFRDYVLIHLVATQSYYGLTLLLDLSLKLENKFLNKHLNKEVEFLPEVYKDNYLIGHTGDYALVKCKGKESNLHKIIKTKITDIKYPYCIGENYE